VILLSYVNAELRDHYSSLADLCHTLDISEEELVLALAGIGYHYNESTNQFC